MNTKITKITLGLAVVTGLLCAATVQAQTPPSGQQPVRNINPFERATPPLPTVSEQNKNLPKLNDRNTDRNISSEALQIIAVNDDKAVLRGGSETYFVQNGQVITITGNRYDVAVKGRRVTLSVHYDNPPANMEPVVVLEGDVGHGVPALDDMRGELPPIEGRVDGGSGSSSSSSGSSSSSSKSSSKRSSSK